MSACNEMMLPERLKLKLGQHDLFDRVMALDGEVFRDVPGRKTIRVIIDEQPYFIKQHFGVGWSEIFKNLLAFKIPIVSASTEKLAIEKLGEIGIPTTPLAGFGARGCSPASRQSFLITRDLGDIISLETLADAWLINPPQARFKRQLLLAVAGLAANLHDSGLNHRDFYICHICLDKPALVDGEIRLYLIDLHRVGIRETIRPRDRMKDMAALYFSAMNAGLTVRDYLRFLQHYRQKPLKQIFKEEFQFWQQVQQRAIKLYIKLHRVEPTLAQIGAKLGANH
ncbi:lipopolysaccharide core heptose(I) kinase RfaP [Methylobacillus gramineus]|uniref:lipopolysaccharide core heptose(I) kinase RfaP n=1 Tax=Methylobacillus gramineus TaxID=755169 RepID=UPI001CFF5E59|nr:lipopolysaccharide core heptose(I) kinase RfaP [Methylobacillus gramineus]MCB5184905.1 lipopolysaccharide core heptose(I) kinase RfaP [Methylobacillus gramineus]